MENIRSNISAKVDENLKYFLTVKYGDAQIGSSTMLALDGKFVSPAIVHYPIGDGKSLIGKTLLIESMVTDVNPNTNLTSITYQLNDVELKTLENEVNTEGDSISYTTFLKFTKNEE